MQIHRFDDTEQLNQLFAQKVAMFLTEAIAERGHAFLAVPGGKTPQGLFRKLAEADLDWKKVTIILTDERWLKPTEKDSNERMVREYLLHGKASKATFISLYTENGSEEECMAKIEARLAALPKFDVVILGMGEDGHTASLFPCSPEIGAGLADTYSPVLMVHPTTAPYRRISLSKTRLLNSRVIFLHLVGRKKLAVLNQALEGINPLEMPIRAFLHYPTINLQVMFSP